jgi:tetratricopeptide (TPR) repeat protein
LDAFSNLLAEAKQLHTAGDFGRAEQLYRQFLQSAPAAPQIAHVWYLLGAVCHSLGRFANAEAHLLRSLELRPDFAETHSHLGATLAEEGKHAEAEACFRRALVLKPSLANAWLPLGDSLQAQGKFDDAEVVYRRVLELNPQDAAATLQLANTLIRQNQSAEALACFGRASWLDPMSAELQAHWGAALIDLGQTEEALAHFRAALRQDPAHVFSYANMSELVKECHYRFSDHEIAQMKQLVAEPRTSLTDRAALHFALAFALEKDKRFDDAFAHYWQGNEDKHYHYLQQGGAFDINEHRKLVDDLIASFTHEYFERVRSFGNPSDKPIFIVGVPRSGTTLVDQILAAHPRVSAAGELVYIENIVAELPRVMNQPRSLELLNCLDRNVVKCLADRYLERLARFSAAPRITDKMPQNFFYLGFIATLFPNARVIHCRRDPMDTCVSCYTHNFTDFSTSLDFLGVYYRQYERLMNHWRQVMPLSMLDVQYEDLVTEPEKLSRELLAFCGLEWNDACLAFHSHRRAVHTASRMQVRRPTYTSAIGRWRRYESHVGPLIRALEELQT